MLLGMAKREKFWPDARIACQRIDGSDRGNSSVVIWHVALVFSLEILLAGRGLTYATDGVASSTLINCLPPASSDRPIQALC
jgi:hypothetical protein